jgi:hypothetical protein
MFPYCLLGFGAERQVLARPAHPKNELDPVTVKRDSRVALKGNHHAFILQAAMA